MSEQAFDPSAPIPNSDPRCRCALEPAGNEAGVIVMAFGTGDGGQGKVAFHLDCPYHGGIARDIQKTGFKGLSIAPR